jgi:flagellar motor switch protein FliG
MEGNSENGIFINGKAQIVEMLKYMTAKERATLLKNIQLRNPNLARELYAESITFETIFSLDMVDLQQLAMFVKPAIMGVALKGCDEKFQRNFLSNAKREYAEEAFSYLSRSLGGNEDRDVKRAQKRVSDTIVALNNRGRISL